MRRQIEAEAAQALYDIADHVVLAKITGDSYTLEVMREAEALAEVARVAGIDASVMPRLPNPPRRCAWLIVVPGSGGKPADIIAIDAGVRRVAVS